MALIINRGILHIINNAGGGTSFSKNELEVDSETCHEFIQRHARRLMTNPAAKEACFTAESPAYELVRAYQKGDMHFKEFTVRLCERLAAIMEANKDIPPADILIADFENRKKRYLAIFKLNYSECYTHRIVEEEDGVENRIVKNTWVLPFGSGRVDEACLIPFEPMILRILEKPYIVNGEEQNYFSRVFLECETEMSKKETSEIIQQVTEEINVRYFDNDVEMAARLKCALIDEAEESGEEPALSIENVARRVFTKEEHQPVKEEFLELSREFGLPHEVKLDRSYVRSQFKTQRFKADNGIELKFPSELFQDPDTMQFTTNSDGTVSITLKNLRKC